MKRSSSCSARYRHKLNMLEPGARMLKIAALISAAGIAALLLKIRVAGLILLALAGLIVLMLLILVRIELHQDSVLNAIAMRELDDEQKHSDDPHL